MSAAARSGIGTREVRTCAGNERMQAPSAAMSDTPRLTWLPAVSRTRCDDDQNAAVLPRRTAKRRRSRQHRTVPSPAAERQPAQLLAQGGQDAVAKRAPLDAPSARRRFERRNQGLCGRDDPTGGRSLFRPLPAAADAVRGSRALPVSDQIAPAQRQLDEGRARPLCRPYRRCAGDDARAPHRPILVPLLRPARFATGPGLAPLLSRAVSGWLPDEGQGDRGPAAARRKQGALALSGPAQAHSQDNGGASSPRRLRPAELWPLPARRRSPDPPRRQDGHAHADLVAAALAAGADRPARRRPGA